MPWIKVISTCWPHSRNHVLPGHPLFILIYATVCSIPSFDHSPINRYVLHTHCVFCDILSAGRQTGLNGCRGGQIESKQARNQHVRSFQMEIITTEETTQGNYLGKARVWVRAKLLLLQGTERLPGEDAIWTDTGYRWWIEYEWWEATIYGSSQRRLCTEKVPLSVP